MEFNALNGHDAYAWAVSQVLIEDEPDRKWIARSPRSQATRDLGFVSIMIRRPETGMLPLGTRPNINTRIAAVEAAQLVAGYVNTELISRIAPALDKFKEPTGYFHGAYGSRIQDQVLDVVKKIELDRDTRQGVITLWNPKLDYVTTARDIPCTVALGFNVTRDTLNMNVQMRSSDIWLGIPYDFFQFSQLQFSLARALALRTGWYRHTTWSLHAYERDIEKLKTVDIRNISDDFEPSGFGHVGDSWSVIKKRALGIVIGEPKLRLDNLTHSELWYVARFAKTEETT